MKSYHEIKTDIERLRVIIEKSSLEDLPKQRNWGGADVIITNKVTPRHQRWLGDQPPVISLQKTDPQKRLVVTKYSHELSWLFNELKSLFHGYLDHMSKYDFYAFLAEGALSASNPNGKEILRGTLDGAVEFLDTMNKSEMMNMN